MDSLSPQTCLQCGKTLVGRSDKRFCDAYCRNSYNNLHKSRYEQKIQATNSAIRRNRTILKTLCPVGKATVRREVLDKMGFSFRHFTSLHGSITKSYFLCYDYAFMPIIEKSMTDQSPVQKVLIIQQQEFMRSFDPWEYLLDNTGG